MPGEPRLHADRPDTHRRQGARGLIAGAKSRVGAVAWALSGMSMRVKTRLVTVKRIKPNILSERFDESRSFYNEVIGLDGGYGLDWILFFRRPIRKKSS